VGRRDSPTHRASRSDSRRARMSLTRTGPLTFRMIDREVSSMNSTRTWVTPPRDPVRPRTCSISECPRVVVRQQQHEICARSVNVLPACILLRAQRQLSPNATRTTSLTGCAPPSIQQLAVLAQRKPFARARNPSWSHRNIFPVPDPHSSVSSIPSLAPVPSSAAFPTKHPHPVPPLPRRAVVRIAYDPP